MLSRGQRGQKGGGEVGECERHHDGHDVRDHRRCMCARYTSPRGSGLDEVALEVTAPLRERPRAPTGAVLPTRCVGAVPDERSSGSTV